jgi:stearoyl-CoA desaturase (delta-9 desaturase)
MFGTRPYNKNIEPTNNIFVSIITLGEGWHNWHHEYPKDWRGSEDLWYILITFSILKYLFLGG